ncbi:hypothetical protein [Planomonospora algeriensis]
MRRDPLAHALLAPLAAEHMTALAGEYGEARARQAVRALVLGRG